MSNDEIPFDLSFHFDGELRDVPNRPEEVRAAVVWLGERVGDEALDLRRRARLAGMLAVCARMLHDYPAALAAAATALELAGRLGDARLALVNRARLAHVYQWQGDFARSDALFDELLAACAADPDLARYRHAICQHAGKNLFDQGRYAQAVALFEEALALREGLGDPELIASTQLALVTARERQDRSS
ncbi:MAG TPA: tetratricopeptide repeat protein [Roseiflexaceae bacterium]|nr:tetratricopeptide repeat protein [Roseiflexaceae bacterium]